MSHLEGPKWFQSIPKSLQAIFQWDSGQPPKCSKIGFRAARLAHPEKKVGAKTVRDPFAHPRTLPKHQNYSFWNDLGPLKETEKNRFFDIFGQKSVPAAIRDLTVAGTTLFMGPGFL